MMTAQRKRWEGVEAATGLLERDTELEQLVATLRATGDGTGGLVLLEGAAGLGKSRLLEVACEVAVGSGMLLLHARGEELETALPWSLARALLDPVAAQPQWEGARALLNGAAGGLVKGPSGERWAAVDAGGEESILRVAHALFWMVAGLAEERPLALVIDDAHWADDASARFVAYLASRLKRLPAAVLLARRPREPGRDPGVLDQIARHPDTQHVELAPLSHAAVGALTQEALGDAEPDLVTACLDATAGNPFYLHELLRELSRRSDAGGAIDAATVGTVAPAEVARNVLVRLGPRDTAPARLARAVAVFGERAPLAQAAELADLEIDAASRALDDLAGVAILERGEPLSFAHPLVVRVVYDDLAAGERSELHLRAAHMLARDGFEPQRVAMHLLAGGRRGDPWAVDALCAAARSAQAQGASEAAADYLARALEEPPAPEQRAWLLSELGRVEATLGRASAAERLLAALDIATDAQERARLLFELGRALTVAGELMRAADSFEAGIAELDDPSSELGRELRAAWWMAARTDTRLRARVAAAGEPDLIADGQEPTPGQRQLLAQLALQRAFEGRPPAHLRALAERAWGDGALLAAEGSDGVTWSLVTGALMAADELERELEICEEVVTDARRRGSPMAYATLCYCRGWPLLWRGQVDEALADFQTTMAARADGWATFVGAAAAGLALALVESGAVAEARSTLALLDDTRPELERSLEYMLVLIAHGRVQAAEGRPAEALESSLRVGEMLRAVGFDAPNLFPWHADAVFSAVLAGEPRRARELAPDALADARRCGVPNAIARALRARAATERGGHAIETLREAVAVLADSPPRLERAHVLVDLGAALRRGHRRADAVEPLSQGLRLAGGGGARALVERAQTELAAAGFGPARDRTGVEADTLTPSERRVAQLAADGHSNREIAQMLFVTVKTVEYHLANTYRKLDIRRRGQLAGHLRES
jgi:DNA-binding CsgD family transcriptional regulator